MQSTRIDDAGTPRERFVRACAEAMTSGDTKLAKLAHAAIGALLDDASEDVERRVADLAAARARRGRAT